jgi:hypothetical protein
MNKYDLEEVRRRMKGIPVGWKPRPVPADDERGVAVSVPFPTIKVPMPHSELEGDIAKAGGECEFYGWLSGIDVTLTTPADPNQRSEVIVTVVMIVDLACYASSLGGPHSSSCGGPLFDRYDDKYLWDMDSGELTYLGPADKEPGDIRAHPCWYLVRLSIRPALQAIADSLNG